MTSDSGRLRSGRRALPALAAGGFTIGTGIKARAGGAALAFHAINGTLAGVVSPEIRR